MLLIHERFRTSRISFFITECGGTNRHNNHPDSKAYNMCVCVKTSVRVCVITSVCVCYNKYVCVC